MTTLEIMQESTILDIGCGDGRNYTPPKDTKLYYGIDANNRINSFPKAKNRFFYQYDFSNGLIPFIPDKTFDIVLLIDVIEHLNKNQALLLIQEAERIAVHSVHIYTPNDFLEQNEKEGKLRDPTFNEYDIHRSGFTEKELKELGYETQLFSGDNVHNRSYQAVYGIKYL